MRTTMLSIPALALIAIGAAAGTAYGQCGDPNDCSISFSDPFSSERFGEVNLSGATLFEPFFTAPATTNDAIDVDMDGFFGWNPDTFPFVDQLASNYDGGCGLGTFWAVSYRSVGSINGLGEFIDYQLCGQFATSVPPESGLLNRFEWAAEGVKLNGPGVDCLDDDGFFSSDGTCDNDDGSPFCRGSVDGACMDVPGTWAVKGTVANEMRFWSRKPGQPGYGDNPVLSTTGWKSELQSLTRTCGDLELALNTDTDNPDENTIYDTGIAWAPITYIANQGLARPDLDADGEEGDIRLSDIKHYLVTGRLRHGENIAGAARSSGSGTRNGIQNTTGVDPAWGDGDNLDDQWSVTADAWLGADRRLSNAKGSSNVEEAVEVSRLAIGFTGAAGGSRSASDSVSGKYEVLNILFDDRVDDVTTADYVRPDVDAIVDNADPKTGWQLGGLVTITTLGDPFEDDPNTPQHMEARSTAWYLRNIVGSAQAFAEFDPNVPVEFNMPGEFLSTVYFLTAGIEALLTITDPTIFVENDRNEALADFMKANNDLGSGEGMPAYGSKNPNGRVPKRKFLADGYADGQQQSYAYLDAGGVERTIAGGNKLAARNRVQGDFNRDEIRNILDIPQMLVAFEDPMQFEQGLPEFPIGGSTGDMVDNVVIAHVIGDFDGTGSFDAADVRYFADGLALDPTMPSLDPTDPIADDLGDWLNRRQAFIDVDEAWVTLGHAEGNFFGTALATGKAYVAGDSQGDIAGSAAGVARGADPRGADGIVDARDIDRVYEAFRNDYLGYDNDGVDWDDLNQAVYADLSGDMTGPEIVNGRRTILINQADVDYLVQIILGTDYGDVDLDGDVDDDDYSTVQTNQGLTPAGWADGDLNGDNIVDDADLAFFAPELCAGDLNCDGIVDFDDIDPFVAALGCQGGDPNCWDPACPWLNGDCNGDETVDFDDIDPFVARIGVTCE